MKRFKRLLLCGLTICAVAISSCIAIGEDAGETPQPTANSAMEPSPSPTIEVSGKPSPSPTTEVSAEPSPSPTTEVSAEPLPSPTTEVSSEPSASPTNEVSYEPSPSPSAAPVPTPDANGTQVHITAEGDAQMREEVWYIAVNSPKGKIGFGWSTEVEAQSYLVYTQDAQGARQYIGQTQQTSIELDAARYGAGRYMIYVGAVTAEERVVWGGACFEIARQGDVPQGFPAGFHGGGGFHGGAGNAFPEAAQQGFRITPGEALTDKHASGTKNSDAYTYCEISESDAAVNELALERTQTKIVLDDGASGFFVEKNEGTLTLRPEAQGESWKFSALALKTLANSGVSEVVFCLKGEKHAMHTQTALCGAAYAQLRARGYVDKDMEFVIDGQGVRVCVAQKQYSINESGELTLLEG